MTEETTTEVRINDLLTGDSIDSDKLEIILGKLKELELADARRILADWRWEFRTVKGDLERQMRRANHIELTARGLQAIIERDRETVQDLYGEPTGDDQIPTEDRPLIWEPIWRAIVMAGILSGNANDVHNLVASDDTFGEVPERAWSEVSADLRQEDGRFPDPVPMESAVGRAVRNYQQNGGLVLHPANPRLATGWRAIWMTAKSSAGLCDVWDKMAELFGIPRPELPTRSGWVTVDFSGSVSVRVDDVPYGEDASGYIDTSDIISELDWSAIDNWEVVDEELS